VTSRAVVRRWYEASAPSLLAAGLVVGTLADTVPARNPPVEDGYRILAVDFHVHAFPGDGALAPWILRREAAREGLDAITITNHNQTGTARLGAWLPREDGSPLVLIGQEVTAPDFHLIAVGIREEVDWRLPPAAIVDAIHAQGGAAIAAHPSRSYWGYDDTAMTRLDGAEVALSSRTSLVRRAEVDAFFDRARQRNPGLAPIGASDFHFSGPIGRCRTYVFTREWSVQGIVDAIRAGRTVAYDDRGRGRGDPARLAVVERIRRREDASARGSQPWRHVSVSLSLFGLCLLACGTRL
jgi:predicted metal-dependent phosphoesterase TrpH